MLHFLPDLVALALLACNGGGAGDSPDPNPNGSNDTGPPPGSQTILELVSSNPDLSTLADALAATGLDETLATDGPFTLFAPTNQAFLAIANVTAGLTPQQLTDVLSYHVFPGTLTSDAIPAKADSLLLNPWGHGVSALFDTSAGVVVNGSSTVVGADILASNGVIHVVDQVLLPPTVVGVATNAGLTELLDAVGAADGDLGTVLSGPGPFTLFAPTNQAFLAIANVTAGLSPAQLQNVLLYHVVDGATPLLSTDLFNGPLPTLLGQPIQVNVDNGVTVNGANVVLADVNATNGVVHVIDQVLIPN